MASGSPSRRRQISATGGVLGSSARSPARRPAPARRRAAPPPTPSTSSADRGSPSSGTASGGTGNSCSPESCKPRPARDQDRQTGTARRAGRRRAAPPRAPARSCRGPAGAACRAGTPRAASTSGSVAGLPHAERLGDGGGDQVGIGDRGERQRTRRRPGNVVSSVGGDRGGRAGSCRRRRDRSGSAGGRRRGAAGLDSAATSRSRPTRGVSGAGRFVGRADEDALDMGEPLHGEGDHDDGGNSGGCRAHRQRGGNCRNTRRTAIG